MVLSIFLSIISIFNNLYVIILRRKIAKISAFISTYLLVCRRCISSQWIAEEIDEKKSPLLFLMNPEFHNKKGCEEMVIISSQPLLPFKKASCPAKSIKIKDLEIPISPRKGRPLIREGSGFLSQYSDESYRCIL